MQDFKHVLEKFPIKRELNNLVFSIGFQMLKIWLFQMALNACETWLNGISSFFPKTYKKSPKDWGLPSVVRLSYTSLLNETPKLLALFNY